ncbi:protein Churchill [Pelomyxa schiedti]|nr:protein Churchill [Pelomyxa schiedti]
MCKGCIVRPFVDREGIVLETGTYLANFKGCASCGRMDQLATANKVVEVDDVSGAEHVEYTHNCGACGHLVAKHTYDFEVVDERQEDTMNCALCGTSEGSHSVDPVDPRAMRALF